MSKTGTNNISSLLLVLPHKIFRDYRPQFHLRHWRRQTFGGKMCENGIHFVCVAVLCEGWNLVLFQSNRATKSGRRSHSFHLTVQTFLHFRWPNDTKTFPDTSPRIIVFTKLKGLTKEQGEFARGMKMHQQYACKLA